MATLTERIEADYKTAMKARERLRIDALRLVKAEIQRVAIDKKAEVTDKDVTQILSRQVKQRQETLKSAKQGNRQDMVDQTTQELAVLEAYLPKALAPEAVKQLVDEAISEVGPNQGQIMKFVMGKAAGAADGKAVSQLVSERLKADKGAATG